MTCWLCEKAPAVGICCSSHDRELCHACYRITHFVDCCVPGCSPCEREGLPVTIGADLRLELRGRRGGAR